MQGPQGHPNISPRRRPDKRGGQEEERLIRLRQHKQEVRLRSRCPSPIVPEWVQEPHVHQGGQPPSILRGRSGGRRQFFDTRYIAILRRNGESLGENPVGSSPTPRAEGNLCAFEMALKNCNHEARGSDGPIVFMLSDLNLARTLNRAALGEDVRIAAPLNKRFQRIRRIHWFKKFADRYLPRGTAS